MLPLSWLFCGLVSLRRWLYRHGILTATQMPVPVIVVGNINVGGTGKTPLVIWLSEWFKHKGFRPGIITRGYGGQSKHWPRRVNEDDSAAEIGDEALLLSRRTQCPVYAGPDRVATAKQLLSEQDCNLLISDDGLQHYRLGRTVEVAVIDGQRRFGNGLCLPTGPLREKPSRLDQVDLIVSNGAAAPGEIKMDVIAEQILPVGHDGPPASLSDWQGREVTAVAGLGNPERFFRMLELAGLKIKRAPFPDHHNFRPDDFISMAGETVLMTEKDAVKCESFASGNLWYLPAYARFDQSVENHLTRLTEKFNHG